MGYYYPGQAYCVNGIHYDAGGNAENADNGDDPDEEDSGYGRRTRKIDKKKTKKNAPDRLETKQ